MGFYDTPDYDYNAEAAREQAARDAEYRARQAAETNLNRAMYESQSGGGGDWHIDLLCVQLQFTEDEANVIKSEYDRVFQKLLGGDATQNQPYQYTNRRTSVRQGDPKGIIGLIFSLIRSVYYSLENIPVVNNLRFWAWLDCIVLKRCDNPIVCRYIQALRKDLPLFAF